MRIIAFIEDQYVIEEILIYRCLWEVEPMSPPRMPKPQSLYTDDISPAVLSFTDEIQQTPVRGLTAYLSSARA